MVTEKQKRYQEQTRRDIDKAISKFSDHLMSNSKWVRLIDKLVEGVEHIKKIEFKKIHNDQIGELFLDENTSYNFDYWQNGFEGGNSLGGWLLFKEIEYLTFPKIVDEDKASEQDFDKIIELIESVGQFALDVDEHRLKLICYR
jgi:hypothetical protein